MIKHVKFENVKEGDDIITTFKMGVLDVSLSAFIQYDVFPPTIYILNKVGNDYYRTFSIIKPDVINEEDNMTTQINYAIDNLLKECDNEFKFINQPLLVIMVAESLIVKASKPKNTDEKTQMINDFIEKVNKNSISSMIENEGFEKALTFSVDQLNVGKKVLIIKRSSEERTFVDKEGDLRHSIEFEGFGRTTIHDYLSNEPTPEDPKMNFLDNEGLIPKENLFNNIENRRKRFFN